ncbi:hypothetical protein [Glaciimonas immobilis]|uniref:SAM-dependent methyltransferase n=1 Tax=Glaciimonas immobilis TaxID=728004 RepID=A0A840RSD6_9BURK|nr:hypothetical protein [Glaciimonas immobilis]KAF3997034.1 hypothetical protein HAV38_15275 [Glaciimonas immobilis]MBB5199876.1 hypothetical protein [Glaciimonas immobilis]
MSNNLNFYHSTDGGEIMSAKNFNDGVISLLRTESAFVSMVLQQRKYNILLEMGCDLARNYDIARLHKIDYIGMDARKTVIDELLESATLPNMYKHATFINDDVLNINHIRTQLKLRQTLCLLPFNLIGNFTSLDTIFSVYAEANIDVVISSWQCSSQASIVRANYYANCGIANLDFIETDIAHCFTRSDFRSAAYRHQHLHQMASQNGYVLVEMFATNLNLLLYFRKREA